MPSLQREDIPSVPPSVSPRWLAVSIRRFVHMNGGNVLPYHVIRGANIWRIHGTLDLFGGHVKKLHAQKKTILLCLLQLYRKDALPHQNRNRPSTDIPLTGCVGILYVHKLYSIFRAVVRCARRLVHSVVTGGSCSASCW